ncbi:DNA polymerase III subunit gamma/tau [Candidatus Synechococcus calcipolaris G9]|uniref:DNA polymerase III subunit gamma/tau n=1 Tax=Candidatus Synechococcus calcipolaris G9 TaxID=1497997 RepID=A0ABT6EX27_9SYNE|nr:DNA polymerase III subunit gamma/tau [Candidatus Synechococcus calcipolaris]MDG2989902.1 DNA polymerase III subunit gamma/tau [Candidatus Synechococcus calcipolaris G9]
MGYEPLHHKYRPQRFADLVGQGAIATTLSNALSQERIAPAYLFCGPRGTGKTSSARILAKSLNCLGSSVPTPSPCGMCDVCRAIAHSSALDVIEIDAASNTGVDNIRELIEKAQFAPVQCRYKVYAIDECHMLSTSAFNALLKTLEEPPDRVVFILATTDPQRVLPTIISRCQRFDFRRIPLADMVDHLRYIAQQEQIPIQETALTLVAQLAQGGLRDAESMLDQLSLFSEEVTIEKVWDLAGSVPEQDLIQLLQAIQSQNPETVLERTRYLLERGREPLVVLQNLTAFYRDLLIAKTAPQRQDLVALTNETWQILRDIATHWSVAQILAGQEHLRSCELQVKQTTQPRLWLEVAILGLLSLPQTSASPTPPAPQTPSPPRAVPPPPPQTPVVPIPPTPTPPISPPPQQIQRPDPPGEPLPRPEPIPPAAVPTPEVELTRAKGVPDPLNSTHSTAPIPPEPELSLEELWQAGLQQIQVSTRALLSQHGRILSYGNKELIIGIKSAALLKMTQSYGDKITEAFSTVLQQKIKVKLTIALETSAVQDQSTAPPPSFAPPSHRPVPRDQAPGGDRPISGSHNAPPPTSTSPTSTSPTRQFTPDSLSSAGDPLLDSARSLARFFNGAIVNLEDSDASDDGSPKGDMAALDSDENQDDPE